MKDNPMKILYREFGEKPEDGQEMLSIANIFYLMGKEKNPELVEKLIREVGQQNE